MILRLCSSSILEHMGNDGKQRYATTYYNLDAIISVGYRVNSINATAFRRWATKILREYLLQGYSVNRHLIALQENMDKRMTYIEAVQAKQHSSSISLSEPPLLLPRWFSLKVTLINHNLNIKN